MALRNTTIWEVRGTTGNDLNGGGFDTGTGGGTDYSQQNAAQLSLTDLAQTLSSTTLTSTTGGFTSEMVNNIIQITSGTNFVTGFYRITAFTDTNTVTIDRTATSGGDGSAGVGRVGGALATIQTALDAMTVADMQCYVRADGTYTITTALSVGSASAGNYGTRVIGYTTTRGDDGRVTIATSGAINGINVGNTGWQLWNLQLNGGGTGLIGISVTAQFVRVRNCIIDSFTTDGIRTTISILSIVASEVTGCAGTAAINLVSDSIVAQCYIHDNTTIGIEGTLGNTIVDSIIANNTGASSDGAQFSYTSKLVHSLFYGNGRDGFRSTAGFGANIGTIILNCLFANNAGYGLNLSATGPTSTEYPWIAYNGFWSNTSGAVNNVTLDSTNVQISGTDPTNDPFTAKSASPPDWTLNATPGAGAILRSVGFPGTFIGLSGRTGYTDIGPYRHQDPGPLKSRQASLLRR